MKAYVLKGIGQLEYTDVAIPELRQGWTLVQVGAAGICGSDIPRIFKTGTYHFPTIPGHEFSGRVVDTYSKEDRSWIGRRVGIFPLIPCRKCFVCKEGHYEMCRSYDYLGSRRDGGFAELVAVPVWNLIELPDEMSMEEAAMLEPASVALHAVRRLEIVPGDTVALYGLGTIGLILTQWLRMYGVEKVYAVGHEPGHGEMMRRTAAADFEYRNVGRQEAGEMPDGGNALEKHELRIPDPAEQDSVSWIMEKTGGEGVAIAIDCAGTVESLTNCLNCVRPGGQILTVGNPKGDMLLDKESYWKILRNQIRLTGTWNSSFCHSAEDDWYKAIEACSSRKIILSELITHRLGFEQLEMGLEIATSHREYHNKIMIRKAEIA